MARLVLAALCAACAPAWAQPSDTPPGADLTVVQTAQGLRDAVASGAQHIEIQQHLGFLQAAADGPGDEGPTLAVLPGTRSIRVRCGRLVQLQLFPGTFHTIPLLLSGRLHVACARLRRRDSCLIALAPPCFARMQQCGPRVGRSDSSSALANLRRETARIRCLRPYKRRERCSAGSA